MNITERQQALIDGVEFGIDHMLDIDPEDVAEYHRLTGSRCTYTDNMDHYKKYLAKYAAKHGITLWQAHQHKLCRRVAIINYDLDDNALKWFNENLQEDRNE